MHELTVRPITDDDLSALYQIYASTRVEELAQTDWTDEQKTAFLQQQFDAQHQYYQANYPRAQFQLVEDAGIAIGRLYVDRWDDQIRIIDVALLPEYRGRGAGTWLINQVLNECRRLDLPVTIHVERFNPALRLYERRGFQLAEDKGVYLFLKWTP
ncbi:MAG: GNAT family N-acetyltransferase [Chloroflexi bacterium]|nr:GNAT family N-acetyltransferase [Chloroflexota bacterium]